MQKNVTKGQKKMDKTLFNNGDLVRVSYGDDKMSEIGFVDQKPQLDYLIKNTKIVRVRFTDGAELILENGRACDIVLLARANN